MRYQTIDHSQREPPRVTAPLLLGTLWGVVGLWLSLVTFNSSNWQATAGVLMVTQAFCLVVAGPRLRRSKNAVLPDFLTVFLLFQFLNKTLTLLNLWVRAMGWQDVSTIATGFDDLTDYTNSFRWQAEWVFFVGTVCFVVGWALIERRRPLFVWSEPPPKTLWRGFAFSILLYVVLNSAGLAAGAGLFFGLTKLFALGSLAVLLSGRSDYGLGRRKAWAPLLALLPFYYLSLESGVKGEFALISMPVLFPMIRRMTAARLVAVVALVAATVLVIFPISEEARNANWESRRGKESVGTVQLLERVGDRWKVDGLVATAVESSARWLARGATADIGGLVVQIASEDGFIGSTLISDLVYIFVPRFLWPDKPGFNPGAWFTWYLGEAPTPEDATSMTAMMLSTEMYWMYGWVSVVVGMTLLGVLYAFCWKQLIKMSSASPIASLAVFAYLMRAANLEGNNVLYAIAEPITFLVYILMLWSLLRLATARSFNRD